MDKVDIFIYFIGLIAHVIDGNSYYALMPSAEGTHTPVLMFFKAQVRNRDEMLRDENCYHEIGQFGFWFLHRKELEIDNTDIDIDAESDWSSCSDSLPAEGEDQLCWLTPMKEMDRKGEDKNRNPGRVKVEALNRNSNLVAARMKLSEAKLRVHFFAEHPKSEEIFTYQFKEEEKVSGIEPRAMATSVMAKLDVPKNHVIFRATSMDSTDAPKELILGDLVPGQNSKVEVILLHFPNKDPKNGDPSKDDGLKHFAHFYPLVKDWGKLPKYIPSINGSGQKRSAKDTINGRGLPYLTSQYVKDRENNRVSLPRCGLCCGPLWDLEGATAPIDREACPQVLLEPPLVEPPPE